MQGIVGDAEVLAAAPAAFATGALQLPQGKALVLFTERVREQYGVSFLPLTDDHERELPQSLRDICARVSQAGKIAYIEAELFGGLGTQATAVWENGALVQPPIVSRHAINDGLRALGVRATAAQDEFEALKLGMHRDIEDWAANAGFPYRR
jgi:hypothetical protein